ncbi:unnamed protein product, partial [Mesorhabditis belari]|uniref:Uncharacterized protein n=1 Tax=Mesorhabditis belari TaxID=2138241 RepID=A0AAF3EA04_9BILA
MRGLPSGALVLALLGALIPHAFSQQATKTCSEILAAGPSGEEAQQQAVLLCQLSESATLLAQLGGLVSEGLERLMTTHGIADDSEEQSDSARESTNISDSERGSTNTCDSERGSTSICASVASKNPSYQNC